MSTLGKGDTFISIEKMEFIEEHNGKIMLRSNESTVWTYGKEEFIREIEEGRMIKLSDVVSLIKYLA